MPEALIAASCRKEDPILKVMHTCSCALSKAIELMDNGGLILDGSDASDARLKL